MRHGTFVVILISLYVITTCAELFFKCTRLDCYPTSKRIYNSSCRLHKVNAYKTLADMSAHIKGDLNDIHVNIVLYTRNRANVYTPSIISGTGSFCRFVGNRRTGFFVLALLKILSTKSNVNHSCSYSGVIMVKDFYFDRKMLPIPTIPKKSYKVVIEVYEGLEYLGMLAYYTDVVESQN